MIKSNALTIHGFNKEKLMRRKIFTNIKRAKFYVDGYKLDTIFLNCLIYTPEDVDDLIEVLKIARESLHTQGINHGSNEMDLKNSQ